MNKKNITRNYCSLLFTLSLLVISCAAPVRTSNPTAVVKEFPKSYLDFYKLGKSHYNNNLYEEAKAAYRQSLQLNPTYIPAMEELGEVLFTTGEYDQALVQYDKVLTQNAYAVKSRLGKGRIYLIKNEYKNAIHEFDLLIAADSRNAEAYYYRGLAYHESSQEFRSLTSFIRAINLDNSYRMTIESVIPLTQPRISNVFAGEYLDIENNPAISRAELAALFSTIFFNNEIFRGIQGFMTPQQFESSNTLAIADVPQSHWAHQEIRNALQANIMELFPDMNFKPNESVNKAEFASILHKLLSVLRNNSRLLTKYMGENSPYSDVNSSHWAYGAVRLSVDLGLLKPNSRASFGVGNNVSGSAAIDALTQLANSQ